MSRVALFALFALLGACSVETAATREALCSRILYCDNRCGTRGTDCLDLREGTFTCVCEQDAACVHGVCADDASARLARGLDE
jgi:hypothetical protein